MKRRADPSMGSSSVGSAAASSKANIGKVRPASFKKSSSSRRRCLSPFFPMRMARFRACSRKGARKSARKDAGRPTAAYYIYMHDYFTECAAANRDAVPDPDIPFVQAVVKGAARMWKTSMTDEEKEPFFDLAGAFKAEYKIHDPDFMLFLNDFMNLCESRGRPEFFTPMGTIVHMNTSEKVDYTNIARCYQAAYYM